MCRKASRITFTLKPLITPSETVGLGHQRLLNNHAVLHNQLANLDTNTMAAAAARDSKEIGEKAKEIGKKVKVRPFLFPPFVQSIEGVHVRVVWCACHSRVKCMCV